MFSSHIDCDTDKERQAAAAASTSAAASAAAVRHVRAVPEEGLQGRCVCQERAWPQQVPALHERHRVHEGLPWAGPGPPVVPPDHQHYYYHAGSASSIRVCVLWINIILVVLYTRMCLAS